MRLFMHYLGLQKKFPFIGISLNLKKLQQNEREVKAITDNPQTLKTSSSNNSSGLLLEVLVNG